MRLTQLLSKNQQVQYLVFEYFLHHTQEIALKELAQEIHVSLPTLQKELVSLEEELKAYAPNARLEKNANDDYALILPADFSVKGFLNHYLQQGLDYQLLASIFKQKNISITKMMIEFQISEASIFRRFKAINQVLTEFDIQIKNKKIIGDENQIRFFFFYFFWHSQTLESLKKRLDPSMSQHLIHILEDHFQRKFSVTEYWKLVLWFEIMSRRFDYREEHRKDFSQVFLTEFNEDEMFKQLKNILARYLSRFAYQSFDSEAIYLYLFLLSEGMYLPEENDTHSPLLLTIFETNRKVAKVIIEDNKMVAHLSPLAQQFLYSLHSRVVFYYGGFDEDFPLFQSLLSDCAPEKLDHCMTIVENQLARHLTTTQWRNLDGSYGFLLEKYQQKIERTKHIGVAIEVSLQANSYLDFLQKELGILPTIDIERAVKERPYQLLLVDEFTDIADYQWEAYCIVTQLPTTFEIERIQQALNQSLPQ